MYIFLIILIVLVSILLAFVVLIQKSKGGGLASNFSASNQIMGVRKTTDFLEKSTWTLAASIVVLSVLTAYTVPSVQAAKSVLQKEDMQQPAANPMNTKGFAAPQATDGGTPAATDANAPATEAPASSAQQPAAETSATPQEN